MNRSLLVLGGGVLILVVGLYWKMSQSGDAKPKVSADVEEDETPTKAPSAGKVNAPRRDASKKTKPSTESGEPKPKYEENTDEYNHRIDTVIPDKFRAFGAFKCDESGLDPDGIIRVTYKIRIRDGVVSATNIKAKGERGGEKIARCIEDSLQNAEFQMPRMPDFEEETDLFIRVKTLQKYRSRAEFDE